MNVSVSMQDRDDGQQSVRKPALLDTADIAKMFRRADLVLYGDARRSFFEEVNLDPFKRRSQRFLDRLEWCFEEWFSYDFALNDEDATPFDVVASFLHDRDERIGDREYDELREVSRTNFVSWFWVRESSAVKHALVLEDLIHGGLYELRNDPLAAAFDGATGGSLVIRIARGNDEWRLIDIPLYQARRPGGSTTRDAIAEPLRGWRPDYVDLVRMVYGRVVGRHGAGGPWSGIAAICDLDRGRDADALWEELCHTVR